MRSFLLPWCLAAGLVLVATVASQAQYSVWPTQNPLVTYNYAPAGTSSYMVNTDPSTTSVTTGWTYPSYYYPPTYYSSYPTYYTYPPSYYTYPMMGHRHRRW